MPVKVKARTKGFMIPPHEAFSPKKIKLLVDAIDHYVNSKNLNFEVSFDLITYVFDETHWDQTRLKTFFIFLDEMFQNQHSVLNL